MADATSEVFYDFDIVVRKTGPGLYSVSMVAETGKKVAEEPFQSFESLANVSRALKKAKSSDPRESPAMYGKLKDFGEKLFLNLLSGSIGREVSRINSVGGAVALRMRVEPDELRQVPWETLFDGNDFLVASSGIVMSRIPPGTKKSDRPVVTEVPRMCFFMMRPFLEEYGDETRWEKRKKDWDAVLRKFHESGDFDMASHEVVTLDQIHDVLSGDKYEIIHLFCQSEDSQVLLAEGELIGIQSLAHELTALSNLRLLVIASSSGNNIAIEQIGRELVAAQVPGVLIMPFEMGEAQERAFLSTFYTAIAAGKRLDYATTLGRRAMLEIGEERADFMLPMFFMSLPQPFSPPAEKKPKPAAEPSAGDEVSKLRMIIAGEQGARKALALARLGQIQQKEGEFNLALENYGLADMLFEELKDKQNRAVALNNTANVLMTRGEFAKAVDPLSKCIELRKELGAKDEVVIAQNKLGYCYRRTARLKKAVEMYRSSLDINQQLQDRAAMSDSYFNLGITYEKMGELEAATEMFEKSAEEATKLGDDARATDALEYLTAVCLDTENYAKAKDTCKRCLELREKLKDRRGSAVTLSNLGSAELRLGEFEDAKKRYEEALEICRSEGKTTGVVSCLHNLAFLQRKCGKLQESVSLAVEARSIANKNSIGEVEFLSTALLEQIKVEVGPNTYADYLGQAEEKLKSQEQKGAAPDG